MKQLFLLLSFLVSIHVTGQQVLVRNNTAATTNKSWQSYRQNSPGNTYGNSFVLFEINYDSILLHPSHVQINILDNRLGYTPSKKYVSADNNGFLFQESFDNLTFSISQISGLSTMLSDRPTFSQVSASYQPIGSYLIGNDTISISNRINNRVKYSDTISILSGYARTSTMVSALSTKENIIIAGTTGQYYRGDKTWQTLDKNAVGLSNVDNTSDLNKPISSATQTALNSKQNTLISGTTLKTVGGISLLGSGDIPVGTSYSAGSGISISSGVISNSAPDQTISLTAGRGISITGTYPNFTISLMIPTITVRNAALGNARSLNSNFTVSSTKEADVTYTVTCSVTNPLLVGTSSATAFLEYSTDGGTTWISPSQAGNSSGVGITVTIQLTNGQTGVLVGKIPANALTRIRTTTTGTASVTYVTGQETVY